MVTSDPEWNGVWESLLWAGEDIGPSAEFSLGDQESQHFFWVQSKGENQETKLPKVGEEGAGGFCVLREGTGEPSLSSAKQFAYTHQGTITIQFFFQRTILKTKRSLNNDYTGNISVETVPGKPEQITLFKREFKLSLLRLEGFTNNSCPQGLPGPQMFILPRPCPWQLI